MSEKFTVVIGKNADGGFAYFRRQGWWKQNNIVARAMKKQFVGEIRIGHWMEDSTDEGRTSRIREKVFVLQRKTGDVGFLV